MRVLIGPSILLCSFVSSAYGGAWMPEKDSGKLIANRIEKTARRKYPIFSPQGNLSIENDYAKALH